MTTFLRDNTDDKLGKAVLNNNNKSSIISYAGNINRLKQNIYSVGAAGVDTTNSKRSVQRSSESEVEKQGVASTGKNREKLHYTKDINGFEKKSSSENENHGYAGEPRLH